MNILVAISYYTPYVSGLTIYAQRLAEELAKRGHTVSVLTSQHQKDLPVKEVINHVSIIRVPYLLRISKGFIMPLYILEVFKAVRNQDCIVINLPQLEGCIVALCTKLLGKRLFCIYHCEVRLPKSLLNNITVYILHIANAISLLLADKVITNTQDFAEHSTILSHFSTKCIYIYPPVMQPIIDKTAKEKLKQSIPKKTYYIGVVSRIASEKGIDHLLETLPLLKKALADDFIILLAGPKHPVGEEIYWKKIIPLIQQYAHQVHVLGILPAHAMGAFYSLLHVLVLPSINSTESFGMVQVEAMLCGIPVVASDLPGVRVPIWETGMGEVAQPKNPQDLAEKVVKIINNKKQYMKKREFIEKIFSLNASIDEYEKLLVS